MVSKNNRYLKDVLQADKAQHWSLRKLGIGVTSVLLGTTFYLGGNTVAHADTAAPATAPADNGGQVATVSPAESGNTTVLKASASTASSQSVAPQSAVASTTPQSATVAQSANNAVSQNPATSSSTTTLASSSAASNAPADQATSQLNVKSSTTAANTPAINQSLASNDQTQAKTYWADQSEVKLSPANSTADLPENNQITIASWVGYEVQGNFTVKDASELKKGDTINLATITNTSSNGKVVPLSLRETPIKLDNGALLGNLFLTLPDNNGQQVFGIKVTEDSQLIGKVTGHFNTFSNGDNASGMILNYQTPKDTFLPLATGKFPYSETVTFAGANSKPRKYNFNFSRDTFPAYPMHENYYANVATHNTVSLDDYTYNRVIPNASVLNDLVNSHGEKGAVNLATQKFFYRINAVTKTGQLERVDDPESKYGLKLSAAAVCKFLFGVDGNGVLRDENVEVGDIGYTPKQVANDLTIAQMDKDNFTGVEYSFQKKDGSYLVVFHIPNADLKFSKDNFDFGAKTLETVALDKDPQKAFANTKKFYGGALQNTAFLVTPQVTLTVTDSTKASPDIAAQIQALDAQGNNVGSSYQASPALPKSTITDQAGINVHYLNIDTGLPMAKELTSKTSYADPNTKQTLNVSNFAHYHLVAVNGNVAQLGNGHTITKGSNDVFVTPNNVKNGQIEVTYPGQRNQIGNVYVFYQGDDEQGEVQFLDADTKDAKGPNGYKLLETKQTNKGHYGSNFSFPAGQDPETILNHYVYTAHYQYQPASKLNQEANAYRFNRTYTYTDKANNNRGNVYYIYLNHATTPLNRTVKRTIRYIKSDGTPMTGVSDQVQTVTFTGSHDLVTNTDNWNTNQNNTFGAVPSKQISGYTVSQESVPEVKGITPTTPDDIETVVYTPIVNIKNLTVDYVDDVNGTTLQADHFAGNEGESANYNTTSTIQNYENRGYQLVNDPTKGQNLKYDGRTYTIHFTHTVVPVTPNQPQPDYNYGRENLLRKVTRTINYINADGKLVGNKTDAMNFVGTGYFDKVTHQLVSVNKDGKITGIGHLDWVPDKESLPAVTSPAIDGEHVALITPADQADGTNVKGVTFDYNSGDLMVDVYYVKDNMVAKNAQTVNIKQTVHFIDAAGKTVLPDNVQTITFNRTPDVTNETTGKTTTGAWDKTSDTYQDVTVPTLNGYVANTKLVKGQTVTHDSKDVVVTVVYQPTGKIVPVDQHGNPIKGAATPQYPTDPTDPTKVVPNEAIPAVPGYRPADGQSTTVTPTDPIQNTDVRYTNEQVAVISYVDANTGKQLATSGPIYGESNSPIAYSTKGELVVLGAQGYRVISDDFDTKAPQMFDHDVYTQQNYTILLSNSQGSQGSQGSNSQQSQSSQGSNSQQSQGSQGSNSQQSQGSQGSNSQQSQGSQGSNSQQSQTSQGSNSQQSQGSQGSNSQQSQGSQGSNSQQSQGSQGSNSQQSQGSQGSNSQQSQGSQGSNSQQSQGSQGSNSQQSQGSQGSNSQQSQGSQDSNSQQSQGSQGSNSQQSQGSQGSNSQQSQGSQGSNSQQSQGSQGSNSQQSQGSQGSNSQQSQGSQGSNSQQSQSSQGSNSQQSQGSQGSNSQQSQGSQGSNSQQSQGSQGSNSQQSQTSQGSNSQQSQGSQGSNSQQSQGSQGSNSQQSQGSQGSNSQQSQGSQGSNSQQSQGSQGSNSQQSQGSQGSNSQQSQGSQGSNSQQSQGSQGSNSQQSQGSQGSQQSQGSQGSNSQQSQGSQGSNSQQSQGSQGSNSQQSQGSQGSNSQQSQTSQGLQGSNSQQSQGSQGSNSQQSQGSQVTPNDGQTTITITYTDQDNGGQPVKTVTVNGKPGTKLGYDPTTDEKTLEDQGYVIVKNNIPNDTTFNSDPNKNSYTITVKHGTAEYGPNDQHQAGTPINPADPNGAKWPAKDTYSKSYTATVHFTDPNGNKIADDNVQTSNWTRTVKVDKVTGQVLNPDAAWMPDIKRYQDVKVPVVDGYYATQKTIAGQPAVQQNIENTVEYHKLGRVIPVDANGKPITGATTPTYRNDPNDPTKALSPQLPTIPGYTATTDQATPTNPGTDTYVTYTKNTDNAGNSKGSNGNGGSTDNSGIANGGDNGMTNSDQDFTGNNADLNNGGPTTTGYGAETAGTPGGLATASYTGGNGHSGQVVTTGSRAVNNGTTTNAAGSNSTLPQTGNDDAA
ncbi:MAG TPA: YSIRK-type signal peptide-containing protein [Candidatus Limosilactobacillus intestinigallinarum]|nr:YSIRK-type signal peptide-containing protein [Candidatus Limosilactobacillus intestinigallinarum]